MRKCCRSGTNINRSIDRSYKIYFLNSDHSLLRSDSTLHVKYVFVPMTRTLGSVRPKETSLHRRMWMFFQIAGLLALLLTVYIYGSAVVLKEANSLGRDCIPPHVSEIRENFRPKIAIVSFSDEGRVGLPKLSSPSPRARGFRGLMGMVKSNKISYAKMWGYDFIDARTSIDWSRPASWSKIPAIRSNLDKYDWIFWNDAVCHN